MEKKINITNFNNPKIDIVSNVTAKEVKEISEIKKLLIKQIYSKVRWRESVLYMIKNGIK